MPKRGQAMVAAWVRTIFAQLDREAARQQLGRVARILSQSLPRVAELLLQAEEDILAYMAFPQGQWRQLHSTNTLERVNGEIERRCAVVGIFPHAQAALRLIGAVLEEQHDEWQAALRRYFSVESMATLYGETITETNLPALSLQEEVIAA